MGEFFILAKFQGKGLGYKVAQKIWEMFPGNWEVSVIPENISAVDFWRKSISHFSQNSIIEEIKKVSYDTDQPYRHIFFFSTKAISYKTHSYSIETATMEDIPCMVGLSDQKRSYYEKAQPHFWKRSNNANSEQSIWFNVLLHKQDYLLFIAKDETGSIKGFIIAQWVKAPAVYNPGTTLMR